MNEPLSSDRADELRDAFNALREAIGTQFLGHRDVLETVLFALLANGHVLLEGPPGLGKTTLVKSIAQVLGLHHRRIQFTPDLMPADVLGTRVLEVDDRGKRTFSFQEGPIFTQVLLADEINRATPRTQSALLEAMQERQVTLWGETRKVGDPFLVVATQNPIEMEGTYPLPEAQLDRFLAKVEIETPSVEEMVAILAADGTSQEDIGPIDVPLNELRDAVAGVPVESEILSLVARTILCTHPAHGSSPADVKRYLRYGASPRGGQAILAMARARAFFAGRLHVTVDDVESVACPALRHRLILGYEGEAASVDLDAIIRASLEAAVAG